MAYRGIWFVSDTGKKLAKIGFNAVAVGAFVVSYSSQTFLFDQYLDIMHLYKSGFKEKISPDVMARFQKSVEILKVSEVQKITLKPFVVIGDDLFSIGTCSSRFGTGIGIPKYYNYNSVQEIERDDIQIKLKTVNWDSEPGEKLAKSLILSENAQVFGICREILMCRSPKFYLDTTYPTLVLLSLYATGLKLKDKFNLSKQPPIIKYVMYSFLSLFGIGMYFLLKDATQVYFERATDKKLSALGPEFIEAGIEFYDKIALKNKAIRQLMGEDGEKAYTGSGNYNLLVRNKTTPITVRKKYFENQWKELLEKNSSDKEIS